jgi:hypothetical protein
MTRLFESPSEGLITITLERYDDYVAARKERDELRRQLNQVRAALCTLPPLALVCAALDEPQRTAWEVGWNAVEAALSTVESMSYEEQERRIRSLEEWSGIGSDQLIERAERRDLPAGPEYAAWLVLLGRGDLLER